MPVMRMKSAAQQHREETAAGVIAILALVVIPGAIITAKNGELSGLVVGLAAGLILLAAAALLGMWARSAGQITGRRTNTISGENSWGPE